MNRSSFGKERTLKRDGYLCQYCGQETTGVDHVIPHSHSVDNSLNNLVTCCSECNSLASNKLFANFIEKKNYILDQRLKRIEKISNNIDKEFHFDESKIEKTTWPSDNSFTKICKLKKCSATFNAFNDKQNFCCNNHRKEYWKKKNKERYWEDRRLLKALRSAK